VATVGLLDRGGKLVAVFHRVGRKAWEHPVERHVLVEEGVEHPCPVCVKKETVRR